MKKLIYEELDKISFQDGRDVLSSPRIEDSIKYKVILSLGGGTDEPSKTKDMLFSLLPSEDVNIERVTLLSLGNMARVFRNIDRQELIEKMKNMRHKDILKGTIEDVLDDISIFQSLE